MPHFLREPLQPYLEVPIGERAEALDGIFERYPQHRDDPAQRRQLKAELYKHLLGAVGKARMVDVAETLLRIRRG